MRSWSLLLLCPLTAALAVGGAAPALATPWQGAGPPVLREGSRGKAVLAVQRRLHQLRFAPGPLNGSFGQEMVTALWAFQKVNRLPLGKVVDARTWRALAHPRPVPRLKPNGARNRVELSLKRQLLTVYRKGRVVLVTHVSTGSRRPYCEGGRCGNAVTPRGDFRVFRKINKWHFAPLGALYRPLYFHRGIAIHGSVRVPLRPASHGCVRVPLTQADVLYPLVKNGMRVYVR